MSTPDLRLHERNARELDLDEHILLVDCWIRDLAHREDLRRPKLLDYDRSHLENSDPDTRTIVPALAPKHKRQ